MAAHTTTVLHYEKMLPGIAPPPRMRPEVHRLFSELCDTPLEERERYYREHSISDDVMQEVESLLAYSPAPSDTGGSNPTIEGIISTAVRVAFPEPVSDGDYCGPFQLLRLIGRGGMGLVYLAERVDGEVRQQVAVKLLRSALDSGSARQQFLQERQILANLAHPNIARLIDAGRHADGHPYLVMEYIEGRPLDEHCSALSTREKVALIETVCEAIASAHQKLIVHRDLKPGNILVDLHGNPRVLDFGIAKLMDAADATETIERRLTPDYASPEQIFGAPVTTATDIYSLGAVLYKLITGQPPVRNLATPPSDSCPDIDRDLDAIIMKSIRSEPEERYATADKFAEDLRAWLDRRPVAARQGERWYHARRQLRRHWALAAAGVIAASGLIAGLVAARAERDIAQQRFNEVRQLANEFFAVEKDIKGLPGSTAVRERIVTTSIKYLENLSKRAGNDWQLKAEIAAGYRKAAEAQGISRGINLGRPADAQQSLNRAAALLKEVSDRAPGDHTVLHDLIELEEMQSRLLHASKNLSALESKLTELRGLVERYEATAPDEPAEWQFLGKLYESMAVSARDFGRMELPMKFARRSVELRRKAAQQDRSVPARGSLANALSTYASLLHATGNLTAALEVSLEGVQVLEQLTAEYPDHYTVRLNLANVHSSIGRLLGDPNGPSLRKADDAIPHFEESLRIGRRLMALDANDSQIRFNHSLAAWRLGDALRARDPRRALAAYDEAIGILRPMPKRFSRDIPMVGSLTESTVALAAIGRRAEVQPRIEEAKRLCEDYRDETAVYETCRELTTRAEASVAMQQNRPLEAVALHRDWLQFTTGDKKMQEAREDIYSAWLLTQRYRLLRDALLAAGLSEEATEANQHRHTLLQFWEAKLAAPNNVDVILMR